eukprot:Phypoly_transcript_16282.p1 GENE.Phypoly_transcript_16282~~Phypoly_transcript_16282.p1  ORF type:complete len:225 (+),score=24.19 Phypoly_transcript_16282:70-675(+)
MALGTLGPLSTLPPRLSHILCIAVPQCLHVRTIAYTRSKKFHMNGSYNDPVLRQHELLEEHMSPKFYPGDTTLDEEIRRCEDENRPFLLHGRMDLLTKFDDAPLKRWVEGVVPPRDGMTVELFLKTLGRGCDEYIEFFPSWDHLFLMKGRDMKMLGIPIHQRRWILRWVEAYRCGRDPVYINKHKSKTKRNIKLKKAGELK